MDWYVVLNSFLMEVVYPLAGLILSAVVILLIEQLYSKYKLHNSEVNYQRLLDVSRDAALYAEEESKKYFNEHGEKMSSEMKLQMATKYVIDEMGEYVGGETIEKRIISILRDLGLGSLQKE